MSSQRSQFRIRAAKSPGEEHSPGAIVHSSQSITTQSGELACSRGLRAFLMLTIHLAALQLCPVLIEVLFDLIGKQEEANHVWDHHAEDHQVSEVHHILG